MISVLYAASVIIRIFQYGTINHYIHVKTSKIRNKKNTPFFITSSSVACAVFTFLDYITVLNQT